jgi:hypothetical protein
MEIETAALAPVPPLVIAEGWDVTFYSSVEALNRHLEPWYASEQAVRAYDSRGRLLGLEVESETVPRRWRKDGRRERIAVRVVDTDPQRAHELTELLAEWLPMAGAPSPGSPAPLGDWLVAAVNHAGIDP